MNYHAEVINLSLLDVKLLKKYKLLSTRKRFLGLLKIFTISIPESNIEEAIKSFQSNMSTKLNKEWYITFHTDDEAIIVFRKKVFRLSAKSIVPVFQKLIDVTNVEDNADWKDMLAYAKSLGVPDNQCDFLPLDFRTQNYSE